MLKNIKKISLIIFQNFKYDFLILQINSISLSFLQLMSVLSFAPLIILLSGSEIQSQSTFFNNMMSDLNFINNIELVILFVSILFVSSNILNIFTSKFSVSLGNKIGAHIGNQYFKNTIKNESFANKQKKNYEIVNSLNIEVARVTSGIVLPLINIISKIINVLIIFTGLFFIDKYIATVSLFILSLIYVFILLIFKRRFEKNSKLISSNSSFRQKIINESIYNFKETKIFKIEDYFFKLFENYNLQYAKSIANNQFLALIPKNLVEIIIFSFIIYFVLYLFNQKQLTSYLPVIGVYLAGFYKMLPSLQNIATSYSSLKSNITALEDVLNNFSLLEIKNENIHTHIKSSETIEEIHIKNLSLKYHNRIIFDEANIKLSKNCMIGIYGDTGVGKTTFLDFLCGVVSADKFEVEVNSKKLEDIKQLRNEISLTGQNSLIINDTILNNITLNNKDAQFTTQEVIKLAQINFLQTLDKGVNTLLGENKIKLSSGQIQRIALARSLYKKSQILLMDEPTNNLDADIERKIFSNLKKIKNNKIIVVISHSNNIEEYLDHKYQLINGNFKQIF